MRNSASSMTRGAALPKRGQPVETTKERWWEAELNRTAGEIALKSPEAGRGDKLSAHFERALSIARATASKILGTPRLHEPRTPLARPGQGAASARTAWLRCTGGLPKGSTRSI